MCLRSCGSYSKGSMHSYQVEPESAVRHQTCSSGEYRIQFGCTKTAYIDSNGHAAGVLLFVPLICTTNTIIKELLDPRLVPFEQYGYPRNILPSPPIDGINTYFSLGVCRHWCICNYNIIPGLADDSGSLILQDACNCTDPLFSAKYSEGTACFNTSRLFSTSRESQEP